MSNNPWSDSDKAKLKKAYEGGKSKTERLLMFPERSEESISSMIKRMKLIKGKKENPPRAKGRKAAKHHGITLTVRNQFYKTRKHVETKAVRLDHKTVMHVPVTFTDKEVEHASKIYLKHINKK